MRVTRAIILGAGRGSRMGAETAVRPKCLMTVAGKTLLEWALESLRQAGIRDVVFVGGYRIGMIRKRYPQFTYVLNKHWARTNLLRSMMLAEDYMDRPFLVTYSDIMYEPRIVKELAVAAGPVAAVVERDWRPRYNGRSGHPTSQCEKVVIVDGCIRELAKSLPDHRGDGEFIGMAAFDQRGVKALQAAFRETPRRGPYHDSKSLARAMLIDAMQEIANRGVPINPVFTRGGWIEIDTPLDLKRAQAWKGAY